MIKVVGNSHLTMLSHENVNVQQYFTYTNQQYYLTQSSTWQCSESSNVIKALNFRSLHQNTLAITHFIIGLPKKFEPVLNIKKSSMNKHQTDNYLKSNAVLFNSFCGLWFNSKVPKMDRYYIVTNLILLSSTM